MLHIHGAGNMDAGSYFHFLQLCGACRQQEPHSGRITFYRGDEPSNWPAPLYRWSVSLANQPVPSFCFAHPVCFTMPSGHWLGLQAHADQPLLHFLKTFGWLNPPVLWLRKFQNEPLDLSLDLPKEGLYATCEEIQIDMGENILPLILGFADTPVREHCNRGYALQI